MSAAMSYYHSEVTHAQVRRALALRRPIGVRAAVRLLADRDAQAARVQELEEELARRSA